MEKYTASHEWIDPETGKFGITAYAISQLGEISFIDLPAVGTTVKKGDIIATIESVKTVSEIYAPISGKITTINKDLQNSPSLLTVGNWKKAYLAIIKPENNTEYELLKNKSEYEKFLDKL